MPVRLVSRSKPKSARITAARRVRRSPPPAPLQIGLSGFLDTGRVWQPGQPNGKFFDAAQWHSGAGGGLRLTRRAAVIRADFGFDLDTKRTGIYVAFGQLF